MVVQIPLDLDASVAVCVQREFIKEQRRERAGFSRRDSKTWFVLFVGTRLDSDSFYQHIVTAFPFGSLRAE